MTTIASEIPLAEAPVLDCGATLSITVTAGVASRNLSRKQEVANRETAVDRSATPYNTVRAISR
jgi:hypothetical protein